ncbi:MAG: signal peptidase I [Labilithrix sp.]|nr:signal peptidase I [Labilithrix sp.]
MRDGSRGLGWLLAIFAAICTLLYLFVFDTWVVPSDDPVFAVSIEPTLRVGDRILTRRGSTPRFGQLARCKAPDGSGKHVIGRVFGKEGDSVKIVSERVITNGKGVATRFSCGKQDVVDPNKGDMTTLDCSTEDNGATTYNVLLHQEYRGSGDHAALLVPGTLYLVSDNRYFHQDSRDYGLVEVAGCEQVVFRLWGETFTDSSRRFSVLW